MKRKKIVVALGHKALGTTLPEQKAAVKRSAKVIADLVAAGADVVITHSNAPQVGMIHMAMNEFGKMHTDYSAAPMSVCSAMSEGYIGYDLQNAIRAELLRRGIFKTTSTILTQVEVDPYDDAFNNPVKLIGRTLTKEEADAEEEKGNYVTKTEDGYRRIVAAPKPQDIVEIDSIRLLLDAGQVVIAAGGGGIPVLPQNEELKGASAVIEKDLTSGLMAEMLNADMLMILTSVENVSINYGTPDEKPLEHITVADAKKYIAEGQFGENSMLPKMEAAVSFLEKGIGRTAVITSIDSALAGFQGKTGTIIERNAVAEIHIDLLLFHLRGAAVADVRKRVRIAEALFRVLELVDFTLLLRIPDFQELLVIFPRHEKVEIIVPRNKAAVADCTDTAAAAEITGQMVSLAPVVKHDGHFQIFFLQPAPNFVLGIKHLFSPLPLRSG